MKSGCGLRPLIVLICEAIDWSVCFQVSDAEQLAAEALPTLLEPEDALLRELDRVVEQRVGVPPALVLIRPLGHRRALRRARGRHRERERADALRPEGDRGGAGRERELVLVLGDDRRRRPLVEVTARDHDVGAVVEHLGRRIAGELGLRLHVRGYRLDLASVDPAVGVDVVDREAPRTSALERRTAP